MGGWTTLMESWKIHVVALREMSKEFIFPIAETSTFAQTNAEDFDETKNDLSCFINSRKFHYFALRGKNPIKNSSGRVASSVS